MGPQDFTAELSAPGYLTAIAIMCGFIRPDQDGAFPLLPAYLDGRGHALVWCDHCEKWHRHGERGGHHNSHCFDPTSPYHLRGYGLVPVGDMTPAIRAQHKPRKKPRSPR